MISCREIVHNSVFHLIHLYFIVSIQMTILKNGIGLYGYYYDSSEFETNLIQEKFIGSSYTDGSFTWLLRACS